ncbi:MULTISPECIES: porin [unclassified Acidovorax]|uniref:porin n=1 Tax=unclassified Acidovorax TaxID=2684926 RepID=UPI0028832DAF|nr:MULTISPECIES: porin [unclassified Acidovorax]
MSKTRLIRRQWCAALVGTTAALAAHAQTPPPPAASSVSMFGLVDIGVERVNNVGASGSGLTRMPTNTGTFPSRLGFRGSEDLGGGLRAVFTLEMGFAPDQGTLAQGGRGFGRQSFVGLAGPWGAVTAGRQYSMIYWSMFDADVIGPAVYAPGSLDSYLPNARADNSLAYRGTFSGLTLGAQYSFGRDTVNAGPSPVGTNCAGESASDSRACRQWSAMAKYDTPNWGAALAYDRMNGRNTTSATDIVFANLNSSSRSDERLSVNGYVKWVGAKWGGGLVRRDNDGDTIKPRSNLWYFGATYPVTTNLTLDGQYIRLNYKSVDDNDSQMLIARLTYSLSKRTAVYAQMGHIRNDRLAAVSVSGGAAGSNPAAGASQTGVNVGMRHAF